MLHFGKIPKNFGENLARFNKKFSKILAKFAKILKKSAKISAIFNEKIEIRERCKGVHCVDLGESFPTNIYLQNLASIQPRTSLVKFAAVRVQIAQVHPQLLVECCHSRPCCRCRKAS